MDKAIYNSDGNPFGSRELAQVDANELASQTKRRYLVVPSDLGGFVLMPVKGVADNSSGPTFQKPDIDAIPEADQQDVDHGGHDALAAMDDEYASEFSETETDVSNNANHPLSASSPEKTEPFIRPLNKFESMSSIASPVVEQSNRQEVTTNKVTDNKVEGGYAGVKNFEISPSLRGFYKEYLSVFFVLSAIWVVKHPGPSGSESVDAFLLSSSFHSSAMIFLFCIILGIVLRCFYNYHSSDYIFDDGYIRCRTGLLNKKSNSIHIKDCRKIGSDRPWIERILNIGTLKFYSSGSSTDDVVFKGVSNPLAIREMVESVSHGQ